MSPSESLAQAMRDETENSDLDVGAAVAGGLQRGRRMRRNRRMAQVAGSTAAVVAVGVAGMYAVGGKSAGKPAIRPTATSTTHTSPAQHVPYADATDKVLDARMHLPALLLPLLPSGMAVQLAPTGWTNTGGAVFQLTGPHGASELELQSGLAPGDGSFQKGNFCVHPARVCDVKEVPGGTIYTANRDKSALDDLGGSAPAGMLKPGHEHDVVWQIRSMTFVPEDPSKPFLTLDQTTQIIPVPYADKEPAGWRFGPWPPSRNEIKTASGSGVQLSPDDFAALVVKPGADKLAQLLDPAVPASQSAIDAHKALDAQIAALTATVLPTGTKLGVNLQSGPPGDLTLTGPAGKSDFYWRTMTRSDVLAAGNGFKCDPSQTGCEVKTVPGGQVMWVQQGGFQFTFLPEDSSKPGVFIMFGPTPGTDAAQLTLDQLVAIATNPNIADVTSKLNAINK